MDAPNAAEQLKILFNSFVLLISVLMISTRTAFFFFVTFERFKVF